MFRVIFPSHVPGLLCQAHQTRCLLFCVTSPSSAGPELLSLSAAASACSGAADVCPRCSDTSFSYSPSWPASIPAGAGNPTDGSHLGGILLLPAQTQLRMLGYLLQGCGDGDTALAGGSQAMAKSEVCKMLVMPGTYPGMADGQAAQKSPWVYLQQISCGLNLLAWAFQSTVVFRQEPGSLSRRDLMCHLLHSAVSRGSLVCSPRESADQHGPCSG